MTVKKEEIIQKYDSTRKTIKKALKIIKTHKVYDSIMSEMSYSLKVKKKNQNKRLFTEQLMKEMIERIDLSSSESESEFVVPPEPDYMDRRLSEKIRRRTMKKSQAREFEFIAKRNIKLKLMRSFGCGWRRE